MRLRLVLRKEGIALPINYRPLIHGMIYSALSTASDYSEYLHNRHRDDGTRSFKGFTFSRLNGPYIMENRQLRFQGDLWLEVSSYESDFIDCLHAGLTARDAVTLGCETLSIVDCRAFDSHLLATQAAVRMVSPVVAYKTLENRKTHFFQPDDVLFFRALEMNARRKWAFYHGQTPCEISVAPLFDRLPQKQFSTFKGTYITAWFGYYLLKGTPELIDMLYQTGLGAKNSEGFGMFEAVS